MSEYDFIVVGGGIVGISSAWQLKLRFPEARIILLEKENGLGTHQTNHNSGVIHAGVYYQPGSLKADFCRRGSLWTFEFCGEHGLDTEQCGKLLVATDESELLRMYDLEFRCNKNGITTERISEAELHTLEPNISGLGALLVPSTGITNFHEVCNKMAELFVSLGGEIKMGQSVEKLEESSNIIAAYLPSEKIMGKYLLACAGLHADRVARMVGIDTDFQIVPFRGEYYQLPAKYKDIVKHLIYPIPDPELPFLGVHLTRMIDGVVTVGPNAVLGYKREGYGRVNFDLRDVSEMVKFPGFWKVVRSNLKSGISETINSWFKPGYLKRVQKYCSSLSLQDLQSYPAGIRAQAVMQDGSLVHDFLFAESERSLHVCNAPSPAATSAMPIGEYICNRLCEKHSL
ncbi:L-2-hydroxyglutarate oxidase [Desulforhopalus singaporensis]|uniref:L-2-hydroxyglutarate oxidase n=1 Tax=Desulforhopalus singaporensis TaxID=91360 RepID=A0A1H0VLX4_9BACT|nr:L-2-hydroxyglutarate oxidase [Desulforhopalus singaporensis]